MFERVITVTRKTELEELVERFGTVPQARFYLEHAGHDFARVQAAHDTYMFALDAIRKLVPRELKRHSIERAFVPRYGFDARDLVVAVGQDGLVSNTAKYLAGQPLMGVNPNPQLYDGVLLPFTAETARAGFKAAFAGEAIVKSVTMAEATTSDGQSLLAFNDLFIGANSHISARYRISHGGDSEVQSSSGIIVSTGAGSTGWMRSVHTGALGVAHAVGAGALNAPAPRDWSTRSLLYAVREPFPSQATRTSLIYGEVSEAAPLVIASRMAGYGIIFSDGVEADSMTFNSGADVTISVAEKCARLVVAG
jgi:NAD kinase